MPTLAIILFFVIVFGKKKGIWFVCGLFFHIIFYPIIVLVQVIGFIFFKGKLHRFFSQLPKIINNCLSQISRTSVITSTIIALIVCYFTISTQFDPIVIRIIIVIIWSLQNFLLIYVLIWASNPYIALEHVLYTVKNLWEAIQKTSLKTPNSQSSQLDTLKTWYKIWHWIDIKTASAKPLTANLIKIFLIVFFTATTFTLISYTYIYVGLTKLNPSAFYNLSDASIFEYFFYSFCTFTTANLADIYPTSFFAKIFSMLETTITIYLLTLLVTVFSVTTIPSAEAGYDRILEMVSTIKKDIEKKIIAQGSSVENILKSSNSK